MVFADIPLAYIGDAIIDYTARLPAYRLDSSHPIGGRIVHVAGISRLPAIRVSYGRFSNVVSGMCSRYTRQRLIRL
jgi:hypothetical protein